MSSLPHYYSIGACLPNSNKIFNNLSSNQFSWESHNFRNQITYQLKNTCPTLLQLSLLRRESTQSMIITQPKIRKVKYQDQWRVWGTNDGSSSEIIPMPSSSPSPTEAINEFYKAFNAKDTHTLEQLLTNDCHYQDCIFYIPFEGKRGTIQFFKKVMDAMGSHAHIVIDSLLVHDRLTASATWHIEWKNKEIPFMMGCRLFEFKEVDGKLLIWKITGIDELPLDPGDLALKILKALSTFFDLYPMAAEGLLQKSNDHGSHEGFERLLENILRRKHPEEK